MAGDDFSDTDVPKDFNVISRNRAIALCDDVRLGTQAQHIAAVEIAIVRPARASHRPRLCGCHDDAQGVSQMWLFSLYEFWRTWRQRAAQLLQVAEQHQRTRPESRRRF
jgi:hypothetical protein